MAGPDSHTLMQFFVLENLPTAIAIVVVAVVTTRILTRTMDAVGERFTQWRLLAKQVSAVSRFLLLIGAFLLVVTSLLQLTDEVLLATSGSVAVAVGFGFKDLFASLMAGIILLFDRPFQVGDRIRFDGQYGEVVEIGLRAVRIVTLDDNLVSIPNHRFLNDAVSSANAGALHQMCVWDFWIGSDQDLDRAKEIVYDATATSNYIYLELPISVVVREGPVGQGRDRFAVKLSSKAYVFDGRYETAFGTDVTERVRRAFRAAGIQTPADQPLLIG
jgi:small-conductance mechanosensitive channel